MINIKIFDTENICRHNKSKKAMVRKGFNSQESFEQLMGPRPYQRSNTYRAISPSLTILNFTKNKDQDMKPKTKYLTIAEMKFKV